jgi:hypothetical protein
MTGSPHNGAPHFEENDERLMDLLAARCTQGLTDAESAELDRLLSDHAEVDPDSFDLSAASISLATLDAATVSAELPASLRARLLAAANSTSSQRSPALPMSAARSAARTQAARSFPFAWLAAAAALALAVVGWWQVSRLSSGNGPQSLNTQLATFTQKAPDAVHCTWNGKEPGFESVKGEVIWSDALQRGFMLLSGLPANDPSRKQYQLWIVDPSRDKHPVDGGVFDIAAVLGPQERAPTGEIIVPIVCKLRVQSPAAFALTVEKPGGVVVSEGPLVVVAAPKKS